MRETPSHLRSAMLRQQTSFTVVPLQDVPMPGDSGDDGGLRPVVLVVDQKHSVADAVSDLLNRNGYAAIPVYDGHDALETALLVPPELVIADAGLPGVGGMEFVAALKSELPDCKVLLFASKEPAADFKAAGEHGFEIDGESSAPAELLDKVSATLKPA